MFQALIKRLKRTPILLRITIGNAIIIILSAVIGTYLAHILTDASATAWHFVIFAAVGVTISLILNFIIIQLSLRPLSELRQVVAGIQDGYADVKQLDLEDTDPDIHQLTKALNSLISQLQKSNQQFRVLSERSIYVQEEERKRIARSLHDDTGQSLSTLVINLDRLEKLVPTEQADLVTRIQSIRQMVGDSLSCLRSMIYDLRPAILDDLGLLPAIRWYAQTNLEGAGINVELHFPDHLPDLSPALTTTLFRIAQEGVTNIIHHSGAKTVSLTLELLNNEVYLRMIDDGQGFNSTKMDYEEIDMQHWGLVGIQERIELVGGKMSIVSEPGSGTTLQVIAPLVRSGIAVDG